MHTTPTDPPPPPQKRWWILGVFVMAVLLVVASAVVIRSGHDGPVSSDPGTSATVPDDTNEPLIVREIASLTVPDTVRTPSHGFQAEAGDTYLLEFEATAEKPDASPGDAMYFGASLACAGPDGVTLRSVGGTQNVRTGETVTIRNQFLLEAEKSGEYSCRLSVNSPSEEAAAEGTSVDVQVEWAARLVEGIAVEVPAGERLPRVVEPGKRAAVFRVDVEQGAESVDILSTVHATTCTMVNGSIEDGRTWCQGEQIDTQGSIVELTYRADVLDEVGNVCDSQIIATKRTSIEWLTHHRILSTEVREQEPLSACGTTVRYVVAMENDGPASVVIHRANTTFLALSGHSQLED